MKKKVNTRLSLTERCKIANSFDEDYFVSIHINSAKDKFVRWVEINKELYVIKNTKMPASLIEVDFISNKDCERDLNDLNNINKLYRIIFNKLIDMVELEVKEDRIYRVCIGAYKGKNNALKQLEIAKSMDLVIHTYNRKSSIYIVIS